MIRVEVDDDSLQLFFSLVQSVFQETVESLQHTREILVVRDNQIAEQREEIEKLRKMVNELNKTILKQS